MRRSTIGFIVVMILAMGLLLAMVVATRSCSRLNPPKATGSYEYTTPEPRETTTDTQSTFVDDDNPVADPTSETDPNAVTLPFVPAN